jgi:hypothetical protein
MVLMLRPCQRIDMLVLDDAGAPFAFEMGLFVEDSVRIAAIHSFTEFFLLEIGESRVRNPRMGFHWFLGGLVELLSLVDWVLGCGHSFDPLFYHGAEVLPFRCCQLIKPRASSCRTRFLCIEGPTDIAVGYLASLFVLPWW